LKVSAVIPVYNGEPWLAEALDSVVAQDRPVDELVVVDDGSTDASGDIARSYGATTIRLDRNCGEGAARNAGIAAATGDVIAWLDADDRWAAHHIGTLSALLDRYPQATCSFASVQRFGLDSVLIRGYIPPGEPVNVFWYAVDDWVHTTIGSMSRRDALIRVGGFATHRRFSVDYDLWLRLARDHLFVSTHDVTSYWRIHEKQQSGNYPLQMLDVYFFRHAYWKSRTELRDTEVAERLGRRIGELWARDMQRATAEGDSWLVECLQQSRVFVPDGKMG
jgi:glycosyltransferase involved in cell wall biosynthesis